MAESIDLTQQALNALASSGLGNDSPAEAFVIGYQAGWRQAVDLCFERRTPMKFHRISPRPRCGGKVRETEE